MTDSAAAWRLRVYESVTSTSDMCRSLAEAGEPDGLAILARIQTAGRGSRGREWLSEPGNLFLSLLVRAGDRPQDSGLWALLAGVAVAEALGRPAEIALKWPNDILRRGSKLGGILIESATDSAGRLDWLVVGIGINLARAPVIEGRVLASLDTGIDPERLAAGIMSRITHWRRVRLLEGWAPVRSAWLDHALPIGSAMTLRQQDRRLAGTFAGLGDDGGLLLQTGGRVHAFSSGEIWLQSEDAEKRTC